jgi:PPOX class probable F420-dependent enzyme
MKKSEGVPEGGLRARASGHERAPVAIACSVADHRAVIDLTTDFGARAAVRLREDVVVWLTSVSEQGAPLPTPVWFLWDGAHGVRVQSLPTARRVQHIAANPHVSLNFDGDRRGGDIVVFSGRARIDEDAPPAHEVSGYVEKYHEHIERIGMTHEQFAARYSTVLQIELIRLRGH